MLNPNTSLKKPSRARDYGIAKQALYTITRNPRMLTESCQLENRFSIRSLRRPILVRGDGRLDLQIDPDRGNCRIGEFGIG
jgi:hypothetical protein